MDIYCQYSWDYTFTLSFLILLVDFNQSHCPHLFLYFIESQNFICQIPVTIFFYHISCAFPGVTFSLILFIVSSLLFLEIIPKQPILQFFCAQLFKWFVTSTPSFLLPRLYELYILYVLCPVSAWNSHYLLDDFHRWYVIVIYDCLPLLLFNFFVHMKKHYMCILLWFSIATQRTNNCSCFLTRKITSKGCHPQPWC